MGHHSRRSGTGSGRRTHGHSNFDATSAIVQNYGENINAEMIGGWQLPPGSVGEGKIIEGGLDGSVVIIDGSITPELFDVTPPAEPTGITFTSDAVVTGDGVSMVRLIVALTHATDTDLLGVPIQVTRDYTGTGETLTPDWTKPSEHFLGREATSLYIEGAMGGAQHWMRARSRDIQGNESDWSDVYTVQSAGDTTAPSVPENLTAVAGFRGVILRWGKVPEIDLAYYVVRYCLDAAGVPNEAWTEVQHMSNIFWINNLTPGQQYWFDVGAVDRSENASDQCTPVAATPLAVGETSGDIGAGTITTEMVHADGVNANIIKTGYLAVEAGLATRMDGIRIYSTGSGNHADIVAYWDEDGLVIYEYGDSSRYVRISYDGITLHDGADIVAAITPDGIDAAALRFGLMPGGQNMIPNSSFENGAYPVETPYPHTGFTIGTAAINATYAAGVITITTLP
jgi:hypothetical protein